MFIKDGKNYKTYYTGLSADRIKRDNFLTLILSLGALILSVALMFIPQPVKDQLNEKYTWFLSVNLIFMLVPFFISLYCFIRHFKGYKIREEITSVELPRGLIGDNKTFSGLEIQVFVGGLLVIGEIALNVIGYDVISVLCALLACGYFACALVVRIVTCNAFKNLSETQPIVEEDEEIEDFYQEI